MDAIGRQAGQMIPETGHASGDPNLPATLSAYDITMALRNHAWRHQLGQCHSAEIVDYHYAAIQLQQHLQGQAALDDAAVGDQSMLPATLDASAKASGIGQVQAKVLLQPGAGLPHLLRNVKSTRRYKARSR